MPKDTTCATCRFFDKIMSAGELIDAFTGVKREKDAGLCRRNAPASLPPNDQFDAWYGKWPGVTADDWCAEHRAKV